MKMTRTLALIVTLTTLLGFAGLAYANTITADQCRAGGGTVVTGPDFVFCGGGQFDFVDIQG